MTKNTFDFKGGHNGEWKVITTSTAIKTIKTDL